MEGKITFTDEGGGIIFSGNIWIMLLICIFSNNWGLEPRKTRIFIDGDEVSKPAVFDDDT